MARTRALFTLLVLPGLVWLGSPAAARGSKGAGAVWPVGNPTLQQVDFQPSTDNRQLSAFFGPRLSWGGGRYDHHEGFDFFAFFDRTYPQGDHPVFSILPGTVTEIIDPPSPEGTETGIKVVVTHDVPWAKFGAPQDWGQVVTGYLHLSSYSVTQGQRLEAGQEVGRAGATGYTSTVHLHLNCYRISGRYVNVNPARIFSARRFPEAVAPLDKRTVQVEWLEWNVGAGTALVRVSVPHNAYSLDGFALQVDRDLSRVISFEQVSAEQRDRRDTGHEDLYPGLRLFPLRYNGGGDLARVNASSIPASWPVHRFPLAGGQGPRKAYDILATGLPPKVKRFRLFVLGVDRERVEFKAPGFQAIVR